MFDYSVDTNFLVTLLNQDNDLSTVVMQIFCVPVQYHCGLQRLRSYAIAAAFWITLLLHTGVYAVYQTHSKCFGTGECLLTTGYLGGGFNDEYHRWQIECGDGEAMTGIYDAYKTFMGIAQVWCNFMFPLKPPSRGIYPYYDTCNVRNFSLKEHYCYDKKFPTDTVNTFVVAIYDPLNQDPLVPTLHKCCKTPPNYRLDYNRCQWKYTHDKSGEHYDGYYVVRCDTHQIMTGIGQAINPWDSQMHFVWIQCCPVITVPTTGSSPYQQNLVPSNAQHTEL